MSLAKKLNLKSGMKLRVSGKPAGVDLDDVVTTTSRDAGGVLIFARTLAQVTAESQRLVDAARAGRLAWIAYPKAGQLGTDLTRDVLWKHMLKKGVQGIRQIALDEVWSAMRFRPQVHK